MSEIARLPRPERLRVLEKPFAPIPCRLITDGVFARLSDPAKLLYLFLCIVADRHGTSYYGDARIRSYFQLEPEQIVLARDELVGKDLIGYDGHLYQVLSLPPPSHRFSRSAKQSRRAKASEPELFGDILKRVAK
jgi:hypothetical protein